MIENTCDNCGYEEVDIYDLPCNTCHSFSKWKPKRRIDKTNYYLDIAEVVLSRSTCLRKHYGAVLVKNDQIISTGYNGSPRNDVNCCDTGVCERKFTNTPSGERYELCKSVHAEQNALLSVSREQAIGSVMYIVGIDVDTREYVVGNTPCPICQRFIKNMGVELLVVRSTKKTFNLITV